MGSNKRKQRTEDLEERMHWKRFYEQVCSDIADYNFAKLKRDGWIFPCEDSTEE